jgi:hypothetical protein
VYEEEFYLVVESRLEYQAGGHESEFAGGKPIVGRAIAERRPFAVGSAQPPHASDVIRTCPPVAERDVAGREESDVKGIGKAGDQNRHSGVS